MNLVEALALLAAKDAENALLRRELARVRGQLDELLALAASQNQQLGDLTSMMRRRLQRAPKGKDDPPDDDPPPPGQPGGAGTGTGTSAADLDLEEGGRRRGRRGRAKGQARKKSGRNQLPSHLPVDDVACDLDNCPHCGGARLLARDYEVVEKLDIVKAFIRRRRITRAVRVCGQCRRTTTAPMPPMPCARSGYTIEFLAWLVVQKFVLLVPLDRIRRLLESQGVHLSEGTLVSLIERAADLLAAIDGAHWKELKAGRWMALDGTGLKTMVEGMPRTWLGNLDVFNRNALTVYQFSMTKHGDDLNNKLAGFTGTVVCDAESRHNELFASGRAEANCNAHPRRKFRDAKRDQPKLAAEGGQFLTQMYAVEKAAQKQGVTGDDLRLMRQRHTRPIVDRFKEWLERVGPTLLPSDPLAKAINYYIRHFAGLTRFIDDGDLPIDNNRSERAFQNHAKLRLNALFAGSPEGAHRWAIILGVVETAQRMGLDVLDYLCWAFERRGTWRLKFGLTAAETTPAAYKKALENMVAEEVAA